MALALVVNSTIATNSDCSAVTVSDGTGNYDAGTNPGGYGTPNVARNTLALYLRTITFEDNGTVKADSIVTTDIDPITDASWKYVQDLDGYYQFQLIGVNLWVVGTTYAINSIVYYNDGTEEENGLYQAIVSSVGVAPPSDDTRWKKVGELTLADDTVGDLATVTVSAKFDYLLKCASETCFLKVTAITANELMNDYADCVQDDLSYYMKIDALYGSLLTLETENRYLDGQKVAQFIADLCNELDCDEC